LAALRLCSSARTDVDRDAGDIAVGELDLARAQAGAHLQSEQSNGVDDRLRALDRPRA
jgi:hypothetical protein